MFKRIRYFNKHFLNRLLIRFAGSRRHPFAIVRHVGRRSGKSYETPIIVEPMGQSLLITLTYGPGVDWYRNLLAAGHGTLLWQGKTLTIEGFENVDRTTALAVFPPFKRAILRLLKVQDFVRAQPITQEPVAA